MIYVVLTVKDILGDWLDSCVIDHRGVINWKQFCYDLCERHDGIGPLDVATTSDRLQQWANVQSY